jgi:hypothetical protein
MYIPFEYPHRSDMLMMLAALQFGWVGRAIAVAGMWLAPAVTLQQGADGGVRVERMVANAVPIGGVDTLNKFLLSVSTLCM